MTDIFNLFVVGFSGRFIILLNELENVLLDNKLSHTTINIVAILDENYYQVIEDLSANDKIHYDIVMKFVENSIIYTDLKLEEEIYNKHAIDLTFISSKNNMHYNSLVLANKYNKNIFCEKPIVNNLDNLFDIINLFKNRDKKLFFQSGLTLRYSRMCKIIKENLPKIGKLLSVNGKEKINIGHSWRIMTGWKRYRNLSGGMALEKIVHDYDLCLDFIEKVFGLEITNIEITSYADKSFWIPTLRDKIMEKINNDPELKKLVEKNNNKIYHRLVSNPFEQKDDDNIIPDHQKTIMKFNDNDIIFTMEVKIGGYRKQTKRYYQFVGDKATAFIDVIERKMTISFLNEVQTIDLRSDNDVDFDNYVTGSHAGGDYYVMYCLLKLLQGNCNEDIPSFDEAIRATYIGLLAEKSVDEHNKVFIYKK